MQAIRQVYNDLSVYLPHIKITKHEDIFRNVLKITIGKYEVDQYGGKLYVNDGKIFVIKKYLVLEKYLIDCILKEKYQKAIDS